MTQNPDLSVVIPVHNEEQNVQPLVAELEQALADFPGGVELIFVDDGSTDGTLARLKEAARGNARIRLAHFRRSLCQTAALAAVSWG